MAELDWGQYMAVDTLVVLMGVEHRQEIAKRLLKAGRSIEEPVAFIERGSTDRERIIECKLREVARGTVRDVCSPAVMVIGQVVRLRRILRAKQNHATQQERTVHAHRTATA